MYKRLITLPKNRSFFLFGQRGTGKSSLIKNSLGGDAFVINLLDSKIYLELVSTPWKLREMVLARKDKTSIVVIDEVQKIPALLDEVHLLIEDHQVNFIMTGSSARKLKKSGVNLLAGRALDFKLYPLTHIELGSDFNLQQVLKWGSLPKAIVEQEERFKEEYLYAYVTTYLEQEIIVEQLVRQIEPFTRFLEVAAQANTNVINYENIARDVKVTPVSVKSYFQILVDTLIGFYLPAYHTSVRKRQKIAPKFYFYDIGLVRALQKTLLIEPQRGTFEYGVLFESFVINEIIRLNEYYRSRYEFSHIRLADDTEIDLVIERPGKETLLIEIKSKDTIDDRDVARLASLSHEVKNCAAYCLSTDRTRRQIGPVLCLSWQDGIAEIFARD